MATVTNTVKLPDGTVPDRVDVVIELVASTTGKAAGWITATDVTLEAVVRPTVTAGAWSVSLTPNADITPSGSVYKVTEYVDKVRYIHHIEVGSGGGSLFDLLTDAPASLATPASETYADAAVAAHAADTSDAHDASAVSVLDSAGKYAATDVEAALVELAGGWWKATSTSPGTVTMPYGLGTFDTVPPAASATVDVFYVDYQGGSDGNNGLTSGAPKKQLESTIASWSAGSTDVVIYVKGTAASPYPRAVAWQTSKRVWLTPWPGETEFHFYCSTRITSGWSGPSSNVYSQTVASLQGTFCVVSTLADADGLETRLVRNTGTPTTPGLGEFGYTGGVLYVRLPGDADPGSHTIEAARYATALSIFDGGTLIVDRGVIKYCGSVGLMNNNALSYPGGTLILLNSTVAYNAGNGVASGNYPTLTVCYRTKSYGNGARLSNSGDGFNAAGLDGYAHTWVLLDCEASYNGDEGASPHNDSTMYVIGGRFHHNGAAGYAAVHNSVSRLDGCLIDNNHQIGSVSVEGSIGFYDQAVGYLDRVEVKGGNSVGLYAEDTAVVWERGCRFYGGSGTTNPALEV